MKAFGRIALITGANRGIGLEAARRLGAAGYTVLIGSRDRARGEAAAAQLSGEGILVFAVTLDVTDPASVANARQWADAKFQRLDVLVNNAGNLFEGNFDQPASSVKELFQRPSETSMAVVRQTFEVNTFGAIATTLAFLPLLLRSASPRIVSVSSSLASLANASAAASAGPDSNFLRLLAYNSSKAALNSAMLQLAVELRAWPIKINLADPGHCSTAINGHSGSRTPA